MHRRRGAEAFRCVARAGIRHSQLSARPARLNVNFPGSQSATPLLGFLARKPEREQSRDQDEKRVGVLHQIGWAMFASLLYAAPAQAAKYVPPPLGTSDPVPVAADITVADMGGLAMLG